MKALLRHLSCGMGIMAVAGGCADAITAPQASITHPPAGLSFARWATFGSAAAHGGTGSPYYCSMTSRVQGQPYRYAYGTVLLRITPGELASNGAVAIYSVVSLGGGGEVEGRARCQIPDTDAARRHVNRLFKARTDPTIRGQSSHGNETISIQSDGTGIEGVTGYACRYGGNYPYCNYEPPLLPVWQQTQVQCGAMDPSCGSGGSNGDEWYWGGGGESSEPPPPDDPRPPCKRDSEGLCVPEIPTVEEWQKLLDAIDGIQENNEACAGAKRALQRLAANGRGVSLKVWSGYDVVGGRQYYGANRTPPSGRFIQWDRHYVFKELPHVVHEGLHAYFALLASNSGLEGSSEDYADQYEETCGYTYSAEWKASGR